MIIVLECSEAGETLKTLPPMKPPTSLLLSAIAAAFIFVMLTGCSSPDSSMNAFVGQPSSELLARLGTPRLRAPGENGGQVWTYVDEGRMVQPVPMAQGSFAGAAGAGGAGRQSSALASSAFSSRREFYIDSSGMIYKFKGN